MDGVAGPSDPDLHAFMELVPKAHPYWMKTLYQRYGSVVSKIQQHCIGGLVTLY